MHDSTSTMTAAGHVQISHVCVVMPARNERGTIAAALDAVMAAAPGPASSTTLSICVVDDGSRDGTAARARHALRAFEGPWCVVPVTAGNAGAARRIGVDVATRAIDRPEQTWVLSTDADSIVDIDWIDRHLRHARRGAPAVAGVVDLIDDPDATDIRVRWTADYGSTLADDATHPHVHAANLGIRLDVYAAAGGFAPGPRSEDTDLWRRVRAAGHEPVADASIVVRTSARADGRVAYGFAAALNRLYRDTA